MPNCEFDGWSHFRVEGINVGPGRFGYIASYFCAYTGSRKLYSRIFEKTAGIRELPFEFDFTPEYGSSGDTFGPVVSVFNGYYYLKISNPIYGDVTTIFKSRGSYYWMAEPNGLSRFLEPRPGDLLTLAALLEQSGLRMIMRYAHPSTSTNSKR